MSLGQQGLELGESPWFEVRDGDARLRPIYNRHYSSRGNAAPKITGPGSYVALLTHDLGALWAWRVFLDACELAPTTLGVNCAVFRRESSRIQASQLILEAEPFALVKWPTARTFYTYVAPDKVRSRNPGYCFKCAGYEEVGMTAGGHGRPRLLVLAKAVPRAHAAPARAAGIR